jgi:hypothetical protein
MRPEVIEVFRNALGNVFAQQFGRDVDGIGDAFGVCAAMAFDDDAVKTKENRTVVVIRIQMHF